MAGSRPYPDWQADKTLVKCTGYLFNNLLNNPLMADVFFLVGKEERRIPAHKVILGARSPYLYALLHGRMASPENKDIKEPDFTQAGFLNTLQFLYTDMTTLQEDTVLDTLYAANKYLVPALVRQCYKYLKTVLKPSIACPLLLEAGRLVEDEEIIKRCWDYIDNSTLEVFQSENFLEVSHNFLLSILERETLGCSELAVYNAALAWAGAECARRGEEPSPRAVRRVLGPALLAVRFPTMQFDEFAGLVARSEVLEEVDVRDIFKNFCSVEGNPMLKFPVKPRLGSLVDRVCLRLSSGILEWSGGTPDVTVAVKFSVNKGVFITGVGVYGPETGPGIVTVELKEEGGGFLASTGKQQIQAARTGEVFPVMFRKSGIQTPVKIEAGKVYTVEQRMTPGDHYYEGRGGEQGVELVEVGEGTSMVQFKFLASANPNGGQIPEIFFR